MGDLTRGIVVRQLDIGKKSRGRLTATGTIIPKGPQVLARLEGYTHTMEYAINIPLGRGGNKPLARKGVCEFRSGILIPGALVASGDFVPDIGGHIIPFVECKYSPAVERRIYILPGRFVPAGQVEPDDPATPPAK